MKKIFLAFLLVSVMALSFAVPVMANDYAVAAEQEVEPFTERTRIYNRRSICGCGQLQFRVWGITSGQWLTPWTYI